MLLPFKTLKERWLYMFPTVSVRVSISVIFGTHAICTTVWKTSLCALYRTVATEIDGVIAGQMTVPTASRFKRTVNSGQAHR